MRWLLAFSLILCVACLLFVAGNMMRCISASGDACPKLCYQKVKDCSHDTSGSCAADKLCRAPDASQYSELISKQLLDLKYRLK
jgi:hypothetical protein